MIEEICRFFMIVFVIANRRLDIAKSPAATLQEKTPRTPHTLRVAGGSTRYARSRVVRTYPQDVGYLLSSFDMVCVCLYSYVRKRKHSTPQQHRKNNGIENRKIRKEK